MFEKDIKSTATFKPIPPSTSTFADLHAASAIPISLSSDLASTKTSIAENTRPAASNSAGGVAFRVTETLPGQGSPMHRTCTVDYGIIVHGEIDLILDSGETQRLKAGDTFVQRATMHRWSNPSTTETCRMVGVMMPIEADSMVGEGDARKKLEMEFRIPGKK